MEIFPLKYTTQQPRYQPCCTSSQPLNFPLTRENPFTNYQTAFHPPIAQHISQPKVSGNSNQIPNWSFPGNEPLQPRTEIQTEAIPFEHNFNLQTTNKSSIKLPPITTPNFNGNPLKYHEWINNFSTLSTIISVLPIHTV